MTLPYSLGAWEPSLYGEKGVCKQPVMWKSLLSRGGGLTLHYCSSWMSGQSLVAPGSKRGSLCSLPISGAVLVAVLGWTHLGFPGQRSSP